MQNENDIVPIEVKADENIESKSLKKYKEIFTDKCPLRVRFSMKNLKMDSDILNIPLYMAYCAKSLMELARYN